MATNESRVPQKDSKFNTYVNATADYLAVVDPASGDANWTRLGLTAAENTQWDGYRTTWNTRYGITTANASKNVRDSGAIEDKNSTKAEFTDWVTNPDMNKLNRIGASPNVTTEDRAVFHIKKRKDERTIPTAPIDGDVYLDLKPKGGGDIRVRCRTEDDATRASISKDAKAVELAYLIGTTAPESVDDCNQFKTSTKALFTFNVGAANAGKKMYCFARWIDTTNTARAGSWTDMDVTGIL